MKTKITKRGWIEAGISVGIFALLAIISGIYDLQINIALYNPNSFYAQIFQRLGEMPSYLTPAVAGCILFYQDWGRNKWEKIGWKVICGIVIFAGFYFGIGHWFWKNFINKDLLYAAFYKILFTLMMTGVTLLCGLFVPKKAMKKLCWFAIFLIIAVALSNIIVQIMKMIWSRQRFRVMYADGKNFEGFSPWYLPQGFTKRPESYIAKYEAIDVGLGHGGNDAFKSFPSGHTVAAAASFGVIIIPEMYENMKKWKPLFWAIPIAYTVLVAISRIVAGAHYLSDVLFGGFAGYAVAALTRWVFMEKGILNKTFVLEKLSHPELYPETAPVEEPASEAATETATEINETEEETEEGTETND